MESEQRELALRAHIRHLLLDYSLKHLTTNYVTWSQNAVAELLSEGLSYVSTTDPTDPLFPTDPYDNLLRIWNSRSFGPYDETWRAGAEVLQFIKGFKTHTSGKERPTKKCWNTDPDADHEAWLMLRPMSPVLSAISTRQTPKPGSRTQTTPRSCEEMVKSHNLNPVRSEELPEEPPPKLQDALDLKIALDAQTHKDMTALFKTASALSRGSARRDMHNEAREFLRADSPPFEVPQLDSPPVFARDRWPGHQLASAAYSGAPSGLAVLQDLPSIVPAVVVNKENEEEELYKQHMVVVDGWQAYAVPSSPQSPGTPSLGDGSSEVDELFLPSPPDHGRPLIEELMGAQLDAIQMPRSQKIGGTQEKPKALGHGQSLSSFLSPLRHRHESLDQAKIVTTPKSQPSSPHTSITASMLGQPPTTLGVDDDRTMHFAYANPPSEGSDPDTNVILRRIYGDELVTEDVSQLFINERLDEKDSLLMEVPIMPPPNEHAPTAMFLPCQTTELLAPAKVKPGQPDDHAASLPSQSGRLKKVKGMQALTIELSWIPFKFGSRVPNDAEVSGVADSIENALTAELRQEDPGLVSQLTNLLEKTLRLEGSVDDEQSMPSTRKCLDDSSDSLDLGGQEAEVVDVDIVLTRDERRTLRGSYEDDEDLGSSDKENEEFMYPLPEEEEGPPPKRARTSDWERQFYVSELELEAPTNDSGVFLSSSAAMSNNDVGGFAGMAYAAEGYEGPHTDGDLFLDIDPVHELGFASDARAGGMHHFSAGNTGPHPSPVPGTNTLQSQQSLEPYDAEMNAHLPASAMSLYGQDAPMTDNEVIPDLTGPNISLGARQTISWTSRAAAASARPSSDLAALGLRSATIGNGTSAMAPQDSANVSSARRSLAGFLALMGKKHVTVAPSSSPPAPSNINPLVQLGGDTSASMDSSPLVVPVELLDSDTLCLAESELQPAIMHRYMASVALLQKRVLVRGLLSHQCCIDLIEREDLGDADLILDVDTAVTFASLAALPSQIDAVLARLTRLSWRYSHTLVVFEAYPDSLSFKCDSGTPRPVPYPFSAAVIKAVKKLRRDLSIAEACQTKKAGSAIRLAFATSVEEAASYARYSGDDAEARDTTQGALWGAREWLDFDEQEGEYDLAGVDGMNAFAASIILSQMRLDDFLDTGPEDRVQYFGPYVGHDRLVRFNEELQMRAQAVELTSSSPSSHEASMSI